MKTQSYHSMKTLYASVLLLLLYAFSNTTTAADYYWIGGKGEWADTSHWSSSSGGPIVYSQLPGPTDDVYIDLNSGFLPGDTLLFESSLPICRNFTMDSLPFPLIVSGIYLKVYGNIYLPSATEWVNYTDISLYPNAAGASIYAPNSKFFSIEANTSNTSIQLNSDLYITYEFRLTHSMISFNSNGHDLYIGYSFYSNLMNTVNLSNSDIYYIDCSGGFDVTSGFIGTNTNFYVISSSVSFNTPLNANSLIIDANSIVDMGWDINLNELTNLGYLYFNTSLASPDTIRKLTSSNGLEFLNLYVDTLIYNIPPGHSLLLMFDTLTINNYFEVNGSPGSEIFMTSYSNTTLLTATIYMNMPLACLDYLTVSDVDIIGTGQYYAGVHSSGFGNNWIWSGCSPAYSNVWPGDANDDLVVDMQDFLFLGLGHQQTGPARDSISIFYAANNAMNWYSFFPNGLNYKHADCNGDSTIALDDTLAIVQNYGLTHPAFAQNYNPLPLAGTSATLDLGLPSLLTPGMTYQVPILLGDSINFLMDVHGIAFRLMYNPNLIVPASVDILFGPSWLANSGQSINFRKNNAAGAYIDFAITRFNGTNATGGGRIAYLVFTVKPGVNGNAAFQFLKPLAVNAAQQQLLLNPGNTTISTLVGIDDINHSAGLLLISPNPARSFITVASSAALPIGTAEVFSATGQLLQAPLMSRTENELMLDISALEPGYYLLRLNQESSSITKSFIVQ